MGSRGAAGPQQGLCYLYVGAGNFRFVPAVQPRKVDDNIAAGHKFQKLGFVGELRLICAAQLHVFLPMQKRAQVPAYKTFYPGNSYFYHL
jgi:hypothetical protein